MCHRSRRGNVQHPDDVQHILQLQHEEIAEAATGPLWFQLYHRGYDLTENLVKRAEAAGFRAIVLTVDTPVPSPKERDVRNRYERPGELGNFRDQQDRLNEVSGTDESPVGICPSRLPSPGKSWTGCAT